MAVPLIWAAAITIHYGLACSVEVQADWRGVIATSLGPGFYLFLSGVLLYVPCLVIELSIPAGRWAIIGDLKASSPALA